MYEGCGDWGEMDYSCLARPKMRPNPVALFYKRLFHKFTTGNECEEKKTRLVRDHISKNPGFLLSSNTQEKGMNTELKRKMVSSQALISTFSCTLYFLPSASRLGRQVLCLCSDETFHSGLAAKPRLGLLLPPEEEKTTNCDLRKISPKIEKPMPVFDWMPPKHTKGKS